jgi:hypothetical protein
MLPIAANNEDDGTSLPVAVLVDGRRVVFSDPNISPCEQLAYSQSTTIMFVARHRVSGFSGFRVSGFPGSFFGDADSDMARFHTDDRSVAAGTAGPQNHRTTHASHLPRPKLHSKKVRQGCGHQLRSGEVAPMMGDIVHARRYMNNTASLTNKR